jgi:hypothetical protein
MDEQKAQLMAQRLDDATSALQTLIDEVNAMGWDISIEERLNAARLKREETVR